MKINQGFPAAGKEITEGRIKDLNQLYSFVTKKAIAEVLQISISRFSNVNSKQPEGFTVGQIIQLSRVLEIEPAPIFKLIAGSIGKI